MRADASSTLRSKSVIEILLKSFEYHASFAVPSVFIMNPGSAQVNRVNQEKHLVRAVSTQHSAKSSLPILSIIRHRQNLLYRGTSIQGFIKLASRFFRHESRWAEC